MKAALLLLLILTLGIGCAHKSRALYQPAQITVISTSSQSNSKVRQAVVDALKSYEWIIEDDKAGRITARQSRRSHIARVQIDYTSKNVRISYLSSENLNFHKDDKGVVRIHGTYNTWITNLERAIASRLS